MNDFEACRETVLRAAHAQDHQDWPAFAACFTDDARLQRPDGQLLDGRAAILAAYATRAPQRLTRHVLTNLRVDLHGPGRASVHSLVTVWTGSTDDAAGPQGRPAHGPQLLGEFDDDLRRDDDGAWRIECREARFVLHR